MARILLLTPQLPYPPHQGTSLRNLHMLKALAQEHDITLLSFTEGGRAEDLSILKTYGVVLPPIPAPERTQITRLKQLFSASLPDVAQRLISPQYADALADVLRNGEFDAVQVEGIELASYIEQVKAQAPGISVILDCHNAETELQRRARAIDLRAPARWPAALYSTIQIKRLAGFEAWAMHNSDAVIAVSEADRQYLSALMPSGADDIKVIPNTIDVAEYDPRPGGKDELAFDLVFTGKMDYRPNIDGVLWFADAVWPRLRESVPSITWAVVGQRPHTRLDVLRSKPGITITGFVPHIQPYLASSSIYIVPLRIGSGTRLKILEAMAAGLPIVSSPIGAEGFDIEDGREMILAESPEEWVGSILSLLANEDRRSAIGAAARNFAAKYDWRAIASPLNELYSRMLDGNDR